MEGESIEHISQSLVLFHLIFLNYFSQKFDITFDKSIHINLQISLFGTSIWSLLKHGYLNSGKFWDVLLHPNILGHFYSDLESTSTTQT